MNGITYYYTDSANIELVLTSGEPRSYPWHMHTQHWTVGFVTSGAITVATEAGPKKLSSGEQFFIQPYEPHSLVVAPESSLVVFCVENRSAFSSRDEILQEVVCRSPCLQGQGGSLMQQLDTCLERVSSAENNHINLLDKCDSLLYRSVQAVVSIVLEYPDKFVSIRQMAEYAGYSQWHFLRAFQKFTSMTPHAFQLLCRLRLLRSMLRADTESAAAAASAGFTDQSHMHKVFKHHHGMTPGQFKQASFRLKL
ncbi:helix-turn-helix domain-containing protein [Desulfovibrio sp. MES5]|uniref:AraC family transcriptional regulator n=1 Tax=Desulfovibrio sp. MES5 TaxID=1899016 RepID=UPI0025BF2DA7|nr:helix-turn-helix domain-containing protein [Desulfovibrio sp. MES5]